MPFFKTPFSYVSIITGSLLLRFKTSIEKVNANELQKKNDPELDFINYF